MERFGHRGVRVGDVSIVRNGEDTVFDLIKRVRMERLLQWKTLGCRYC
jgi:hypothetical protein